MTARPGRWVSIDPGDRHVGFATWAGDECIAAVELTPDECIKALENFIEAGILETIVCEDFELYAWNEKSLAGNKFLTCRLIGIISYLANRGNVAFVLQLASVHKRIYRQGWYKALSRRELMRMPWWGNGDHAKDAWVAGEWFARQRRAA